MDKKYLFQIPANYNLPKGRRDVRFACLIPENSLSYKIKEEKKSKFSFLERLADYLGS